MARILFISAPFGAFFRTIVRQLETRKCAVWRTTADGGEFCETPSRNRIVFRGRCEQWKDFISAQIREKKISAIVTFNDTSPRNQTAHQAAEDLGVARFVLENGYLRPYWVTFDRDGVNGNSTLPKDPGFYLQNPGRDEKPVEYANRFRHHVIDAVRHFLACIALSPVLSFDSCYFGDSIYRQARGYVSEYLSGIVHNDIGAFKRIAEQKTISGSRIYIALLQKPGDGQLRVHSRFGANAPFLREVCKSFAEHAPEGAVLVVKQHPLDYGVEESPRLFARLVGQYGLEGRAHYLRRTSIDKLLDYTDGLVTINSTAGLLSVRRGIPTICMGSAIYDIPELAFQGTLDAFWTKGQAPRADVVAAFVSYLTSNSQLNGGFHTREALAVLVPALCQRILEGSFAPHHERGRAVSPTPDSPQILTCPIQ
jgi:capsular polysaccharide export protein